MTKWLVCVYTSDKFGSGTNSNVHLILHGDKGSSPKMDLRHNKDEFETGRCDKFNLETPNIGKLERIVIGHDNSTLQAGWHVDRVEVKHKESGDLTTFTVGRWLADDEADGKCEVELQGSTMPGIKNKGKGQEKKDQKKRKDRDRKSAEGTEEEGELKRYWDLMALSKQKHPDFVTKEDRRSVYWVEKQPDGPPTTVDVTPRVDELSKHKQFRVKHRPSPMWAVSEKTKSYEASPRIVQLSEHKTVVDDYKPFRPVLQPISKSAMNISATPRIENLAESQRVKRAQSMTVWDYDHLPQPVAPAALKAEPSPRVVDLSEHKQVHKEFVFERPIQWPVSDEAKQATASTRVQQLARPRSRTLLKESYDPYKVSYGSLHAVATPRINELCAPVARKQRSKYVAATAV